MSYEFYDGLTLGNVLPFLVLKKIFLNLEGRDVARCREVCTGWRDNADFLLDCHWKTICGNDHLRDEYPEIKKRMGLGWRQTYIAVHSWNNVAHADINIYEINTNVQAFKVIDHNTVAILSNDINPKCHRYSNTIAYFDIDTRNEIGRERYDFCFSSRHYDENEHFIVLTQKDGTLVIILKETGTHHSVGNVFKHRGVLIENLEEINFAGFSIIDREVYFHHFHEIVCVSGLIIVDGQLTLRTAALFRCHLYAELEIFREYVIGFSISNGILQVLTDDGHLHALLGESFKYQRRIDLYMCYLFKELKNEGFDWRSKPIYNWLCPGNTHMSVSSDAPKSTAMMINVFFAQGNVILGSKPFSTALNIYLPGFINGLHDLFRVAKHPSARKIELKNVLPTRSHSFRNITSIDLVEREDVHKVLLLVNSKLLEIEVGHANARAQLARRNKQKREDDQSKEAKRAKKLKPKKSARSYFPLCS